MCDGGKGARITRIFKCNRAGLGVPTREKARMGRSRGKRGYMNVAEVGAEWEHAGADVRAADDEDTRIG